MKIVHLHCPQNFTFSFETSPKGPNPSGSQKCLKFWKLKWTYWFQYTFRVVISLVSNSVDHAKMWFIYRLTATQKVADQLDESQGKIVHVRNESWDGFLCLKIILSYWVQLKFYTTCPPSHFQPPPHLRFLCKIFLKFSKIIVLLYDTGSNIILTELFSYPS